MEQLPGRFAGKVAVITGGANGIGRATTLRFLAEGGIAIVLDRVAEGEAPVAKLKREAATNGRLFYFQADITRRDQVKDALARGIAAAGEPHILINNAGYGTIKKPVEEVGQEEWDEILQVNVTSSFWMVQEILPGMRARGYGRVVNMSSGSGRAASPALSLAYSTAKAAIIGFTRKLAYDEATNGITVNAVAPGTTLTDRLQARLDNKILNADASLARIPMARMGKPEEVAAVILFLASDDASYVTGQTWDINGGRFMA